MKEKKRGKNKVFRKIGILLLVFFILFNAVVALQTYSISHFNPQGGVTEPHSIILSKKEMLGAAIFGVDIPKPQAGRYPTCEYETVKITAGDGQWLEAWCMQADSTDKGVVALFHGYRGEKSMMLDEAYSLKKMGYDVLLVDFIGAGGSSGTQCTIGYYEAENVKQTYDYLKEQRPDVPVFLGGFSMGATAIIKAQHKYEMDVAGIILEAPFGRFDETVAARVRLFNLPSSPLSELVTFWFGTVNGFNAFDFNPEEYVKSIAVPTLMLFGGKDQYISMEEASTIYENSGSADKQMHIFPESIHEIFLVKYKEEWGKVVSDFLSAHRVQDF